MKEIGISDNESIF